MFRPWRVSVLLVVAVGLGLGGCATTPKPAPQPDMTHLVPVNKTIPSELAGQVVAPTKKGGSTQ